MIDGEDSSRLPFSVRKSWRILSDGKHCQQRRFAPSKEQLDINHIQQPMEYETDREKSV